MFDITTVLRWLALFSFYCYACSNVFSIVCFQYFLRLFRTYCALVYGYGGDLHWQRHSGDGRLFHGVMQFSGAVRRRGYGVLKPRRVKAPWGFPGSLVWGKEAASVSPQGEKTRYDFVK